MSIHKKIENYFINENWVEAEKKWVGSNFLNKEKFIELKNKFTTFMKRNLIPQGRDRDIAMWVKRPYSEFEDFLNNIEKRAEEKEKEKAKKKDAKILFRNNEVTVLIPRTEEASCEFGYNTKWCISGKKDNKFKEYVDRGGTLYFIIIKGNMDEKLMYNKEFVRSFNEGSGGIKAYMEIKPDRYNKIVIAKMAEDDKEIMDAEKKKDIRIERKQIFDTLDNMMSKVWLRKVIERYKIPMEIFK